MNNIQKVLLNCCDYRSTLAHTILCRIRDHFYKIHLHLECGDIYCYKDASYTYVLIKHESNTKNRNFTYYKPVESLNGSGYCIPCDTVVCTANDK